MFTQEILMDEIFVLDDRNCRSAEEQMDELKALMDSIRERGLIQPIVVQPRHQTMTQGQPFRLISGYRRYKACEALGFDLIPCVVRNVNESEANKINWDENRVRKNLNCLEEAQSLEKLYPESEFSQREAARLLGVHQTWISHRRMLMKCDPALQEMFARGQVAISNVRDYVKPPQEIIDVARQKLDKPIEVKIKPAAALKRRRGRREINLMNKTLIELGLHGLATRALAWSAGIISTCELQADIDAALAKLEAAPCEA